MARYHFAWLTERFLFSHSRNGRMPLITFQSTRALGRHGVEKHVKFGDLAVEDLDNIKPG